MTIEELQRRIVAYVERHPQKSMAEIASKAGISVSTLTRLCRKHGALRRPRISNETVAKLES